MSRGRWLAAVCVVAIVASPLPAQQDSSRPRRPRSAAPAGGQDTGLLRQLADAQRTLGEQMQGLKEGVEALQGEVPTLRDDTAALDQEVKALREEVKGLYVELAGVKQLIEDVRGDVRAVDANVGGFRTFSGLFIAAMILLLAVIFAMTIRR
jgi:hypothetical protein